MKCCLPDIIHYNQSGFIKDRFIGEMAPSILDIIDYTERSKLPGILMLIDFEKAFDWQWNFLYASLEAFNFGPEFIKWVKTFYKNVYSCIIDNGISSCPFKLETLTLRALQLEIMKQSCLHIQMTYNCTIIGYS